MAFSIEVNRKAYVVDVDGDTPLLWVLRDVLGMTGTKFGCGMALCGACTVHLDGVAIRSCITRIDSIGTSQITTVEAIGSTARLFNAVTANRDKSCPLRRCWRATHVRRMPRSTPRCPGTSAGAAPICGFAKQSSRRLNPTDNEADHGPRPP